MIISPSVGRIVWYCPREHGDSLIKGTRPLAAIITHVHSDFLVNLCVFSETGFPCPRGNVLLVHEEDERPESGAFAEWTPSQQGQAAKDEALERQWAEQSQREQHGQE